MMEGMEDDPIRLSTVLVWGSGSVPRKKGKAAPWKTLSRSTAIGRSLSGPHFLGLVLEVNAARLLPRQTAVYGVHGVPNQINEVCDSPGC